MAKTLTEIVNKLRVQDLKQNPDKIAVSVFGIEALGAYGTVIEGVKTAGKVVNQAKDAYNKAKTLTSEIALSEYTQAANLEPRVMIEETLRTLPNVDKWLLTMTNLYAAYYLQAISLSADIGGVSVLSRLERFNPNRNPNLSTIANSVAKESYLELGYALPKFNSNDTKYNLPVKAFEANAKLEDDKLDKSIVTKNDEVQKLIYDADGNLTGSENTVLQSTTTSDKDPTKVAPAPLEIKNGLRQITDIDNLAVGRLLEVSVIIDGKTNIVPVAVRMRPMSVPRLILRELIALGDIRDSWKERWHRMRAGELSLVSDWIFQSDRIRKKKQLMKLDKQGLYREMLNRRRGNVEAAIATGKVSIGSAASFIVITKETAKEVERRTGMPIDNAEFRNRVFSENSAMMIMIVDTEWETIDCYTKGVVGVANWTFKQFEGMSKGNGPDVTEIMKAFMLGQNPRF